MERWPLSEMLTFFLLKQKLNTYRSELISDGFNFLTVFIRLQRYTAKDRKQSLFPNVYLTKKQNKIREKDIQIIFIILHEPIAREPYTYL